MAFRTVLVILAVAAWLASGAVVGALFAYAVGADLEPGAALGAAVAFFILERSLALERARSSSPEER